LINEGKVGHGVDGAGFGNGLASAQNATNVTGFNASKLLDERKIGHGVDGAGHGNGLLKTSANVSSSVQARARNDTEVANATAPTIVGGNTTAPSW